MAGLSRLEDGRSAARPYFSSSEARAAAVLKLSEFDVLNKDDREQVIDYTRYRQHQTGKLIGENVWGRAKEGARKTNVHLTYTDVNGVLNVEELKKYVAKKTPNDWTSYTKDAIEEMDKHGILDYMATANVATRSVLINIMGTTGGPSIGAEQQEIIRSRLASTTGRHPDPTGHPDPPNL